MKTYFLKKQNRDFLMLLLFMVIISAGCFSQDNTVKEKQSKGTPVPLTVEQKAQIKTILSNYNPSTLTAEQAREIHEKFRLAGIHSGPETKEAIISAGFDPENLRSLAPPPSKGKEEGLRPPSVEERLKIVDEKIIKPLSLNSTQSTTVTSAFKDFFAKMDSLKQQSKNIQSPPDKSKIEPLERSRDEKIKQVLTKEQFDRYRELEKSSRPPKPEGQETQKP